MIESAWSIPVVIIVSYLLGSIPTSIIVGKLTSGIDLREHGSGNAGGTNAFRVLGTGRGIVVIIGDIGKAVLASLLVSRLGWTEIMTTEAFGLIAGLSAVIGHIWTVFARFHGGKGVAAAAGLLVSLYPLAFSAALAMFLSAIMITGAVSVGSLAAAVSFSLFIWGFDAVGVAEYSMLLKIVCIPISLLIIFTHRSNVRRLIEGRENRFPNLMLLRSRRTRDRVKSSKLDSGSDQSPTPTDDDSTG